MPDWLYECSFWSYKTRSVCDVKWITGGFTVVISQFNWTGYTGKHNNNTGFTCFECIYFLGNLHVDWQHLCNVTEHLFN